MNVNIKNIEIPSYFDKLNLQVMTDTDFEENIILKQVKKNGKIRVREISFSILRLQDQGTFGSVYQIKPRGLEGYESKESFLAMKLLPLRSRGINRELQVLKNLNHPHIVKLIGYNRDENNLKLFFPLCYGNLFYALENRPINKAEASGIMKQVFDALTYLHSHSICHRDIKPKNILLSDSLTYFVQICDFGSAVVINDDMAQPLNSYICSRYYRAPELLLGSNYYNHKVDVWSAACVWAEMLNGEPLFWGETTGDQIIEIVSVLGLPSPDSLDDMQLVENYSLLPILKMTLERLESPSLRSKMAPLMREEEIEFLSQLLAYSPIQRLSAKNAFEYLANGCPDSSR